MLSRIVNNIRSGLEDQLLATIVSCEEPELERTRNELVQSFNTYKIQLKVTIFLIGIQADQSYLSCMYVCAQELEDQLLERLSNAPEDILSDIPLIEGLEATKRTANEINEVSHRTRQQRIDFSSYTNTFIKRRSPEAFKRRLELTKLERL